MAYYNRKKKYNNRSNQQQQKTSFACNRKFYSLCSHRLGEGVGLVGLYDKLSPVDNIVQGNIEELCLNKLSELLVEVPNNKEEILATKIRVFVPDSLSYLINGDIADFLFNSVRINGDEIAPDLLALMENVDDMLREKSRNINIRLYQYQPQEMKQESQAWFQGLVDDYLNGLAATNNANTKTVVDDPDAEIRAKIQVWVDKKLDFIGDEKAIKMIDDSIAQLQALLKSPVDDEQQAEQEAQV